MSRRVLGRAAAGALLSLLALLPGMRLPFWDRDEAEYASVAATMARTGDWTVPRLGARLYPDKPPLAEWLTAGSFRLFGESEAAGRLPHLLLAAGSVAVTALIGAELGGASPGLAMLALSSGLIFLAAGRLLLTDSALLFFDLLAILFWLASERSRASAIAAGASLGLAVLAKGPIALLAPGLAAAGFAIGKTGSRPRAALRAAAALSAAAAVAAPWFLLSARATGGAETRSFLLKENLERFLAPMEHHSAPFFAYLAVLLLGFFPWSLLLAVRPGSALARPARRGLALWGWGVLAFFSLAATKLPHYLLPALPAFALLAAHAPEPSARAGRILRWCAAGAGCALAAGAAAGLCALAPEKGLLAMLAPFAVIALASLALPLVSGPLRRGFAGVAVAGGLAFVILLPGALDRQRCYPALARAARETRRPAEPLGALGFREASLLFYSGDFDAPRWRDRAEVTRALDASPTRTVLAWLRPADAVPIARRGRISVRVIASGWNAIEPGPRGAVLLARLRRPI